jgi:hypothetical protein
MFTDRVYNWCKQSDTVTSELAKDPSQCPWKVFKDLYGTYDHTVHHKRSVDSVNTLSDEVSSAQQKDELQNALSCGKWGSSVPSELFLKVRMNQLLLALTISLEIRMG